MKTSSSRRAESPLLGLWERVLAAGGALLFLALGVLLYRDPPDRRTALTGCDPTEAQSCVVVVDAQPGSLTTALIAAAGVLALVAVLGRRFSSVKIPGIGRVATAPQATEVRRETPASETAAGRARPLANAAVGGDGERPSFWNALPLWTRAALYRWAAENPVFDIPVSDAICEAYEPDEETDLPWYVTLRDAGGEERTLRLALKAGSDLVDAGTAGPE